jgi:hypothetical protein
MLTTVTARVVGQRLRFWQSPVWRRLRGTSLLENADFPPRKAESAHEGGVRVLY